MTTTRWDTERHTRAAEVQCKYASVPAMANSLPTCHSLRFVSSNLHFIAWHRIIILDMLDIAALRVECSQGLTVLHITFEDSADFGCLSVCEDPDGTIFSEQEIPEGQPC